MPLPENKLITRNAVERFPVQVTFDQRRGYIAVGEGLPIISALSLASLRRQIDAHLDKRIIARLQLDHAARQERDARRHGTASVV